MKKCVLKNFTKFTRKHLHQSLFLNEAAGQGPETLLKKETLAQALCCEFCEIFKNTVFTEYLWTTVSQTAFHRCSTKQVFLKIPQYSQETPCVGDS